MIGWLDSISNETLVSRYVLNQAKRVGPAEQWVPDSYTKDLSLSDKWRRREEQGTRATDMASLMAQLATMEEETRAHDADKRLRKKLPLLFGATPLLTDGLPNSEDWLASALPQALLDQRDELYAAAGKGEEEEEEKEEECTEETNVEEKGEKAS